MKRLLLAACTLAIIATGCDTYSYPTPPVEKADMKKDAWVYGDVDGEPRQHKQQYPADPEQAVKADAAKKQLFSEDQPGYNKESKKTVSTGLRATENMLPSTDSAGK